MSDAAAEPDTPQPLPVLERRVLGVLIEKEKTNKSPDAYPMTVNAIVTGCNQKSNRDPVMELDEVDVEETLVRLQRGGLVARITGGRVDRWRHLLYDNWRIGKVEMAILAELLLRGPQTEGDLRGRASRMNDIPDLDTLRATLKPLVERRLVVYLSDPERRGAVLTHGFHHPEELDAARGQFAQASEAPIPRAPRGYPMAASGSVSRGGFGGEVSGGSTGPSSGDSVGSTRDSATTVTPRDETLALVQAELTALKSDIATLQTELATVKTELATLKSELAPMMTELTTVKSELATARAEVANLKASLGG